VYAVNLVKFPHVVYKIPGTVLTNYYKKLIRRSESERELFYDDIIHILQSTIDSPINIKL